MPPAEKVKPFSGQLRVRMPKSLHAALSQEADDENISLNTYIVTLLSERHIEKKLLNRMEAFKDLYEKINVDKTSPFKKRLEAMHKIEEKDLKFREKKRKK